MNRETLIQRNQRIADAFHSVPFKHYLRRLLLRGVAALPVSSSRASKRERLLLIRPDHLGDVLLTTPAIHALRRARPLAEIHALVGPWSAVALANNENLDAVVTLAFPGFNRSGNENLRSPYRLALHAANQIRQIGYSSAVIMRPDHWWGALVAFLAGIPQRIGYAHHDVKPFLTQTFVQQHPHAVMQNADLITPWAGEITPEKLHYTFSYTDENAAYVRSYLDVWGVLPEHRVFCIHPGAGTWVKRWDAARWGNVADILIDQLDATAVITGTDSEVPLAREVAAHMTNRSIVMAGDTQVGQLAALFDRSQVVLGPDSGPMHLAAAVDTPTVTLFGPADPAEFAPWGDRHKHAVLTSNINCRPCRVLDWGTDDPKNHPCVRDISIGAVLQAARNVTAEF